LVLGGAAIVCILAGVAVFSQRAPQLQGRPLGREDFASTSAEPIVVSPIPAPVAPVEPSAPAAPLVPVPQSVEEAVHPLPAVSPISRAAESAGAQSNGTIERKVRPAHVTGGQVARIVLALGSERGAYRDPSVRQLSSALVRGNAPCFTPSFPASRVKPFPIGGSATDRRSL
jgi:hypothetical protein